MEWVREFMGALLRAPHGDRGRVVDEWSAMTGRSAGTLWRIARQNGYRTKRQRRADAGRVCLSEPQIEFLEALVRTSRREIKGQIMPMDVALDVAAEHGVIPAGTVTAGTAQRILRERGMSGKTAEAPPPHVVMRSLYPNHVHEWDVSVCIQYYLRDGRGLRILDERKFYKNKPQNYGKIRERVYRYVLVDHYSGCIFFKYYQATGETTANLFDFLCSAWAWKTENFPFRGVPEFCLIDAGAANTSKAIVRMCERLEVEFPESMPHNARRQGSVERAQNIIETRFESLLRFSPAATIAQLNEWAADWMARFNGEQIHRRHGLTRTEAWLRITSEQLRELPPMDVMQDLFACPEEQRLVRGDYSISFRGRQYDLRHIDGLMPGVSKVLVTLKPYTWPEVGISFRDGEFDCSPVPMDEAGFPVEAPVIGEEYKRPPMSDQERRVQTAENLAYGEGKRKATSVPFQGTLKVLGNHSDKLDVEFLPKRGTPHPVTQDTAEDLKGREISMMELFRRLHSAGGELSTDLNAAIRERYGASITQAEADRLVSAARDGGLVEALTDGGDDGRRLEVV